MTFEHECHHQTDNTCHDDLTGSIHEEINRKIIGRLPFG